MGLVQSEVTATDQGKQDLSVRHNPQPTSLEDILAEAAAFGDDENESVDAKAQKALECPCVAKLRKGPCGDQFSEAFVCFLKSSAKEKGSDCVRPFVALQNCIKENPDAFPKDVLNEEGSKKEEADSREHKIIPPNWAKEAKRKLQ